MTISISAPGRNARDVQLSRALGILALAGLLGLVAGGLGIPLFFDQPEASRGDLVASWLSFASFLPWLAALVLAFNAFRSEAEKRFLRLRRSALLAAASFALEAAAGVVTFATLEGPLPRGYRVALEASILSSCGLIAAALIAARAFIPARATRERQRGLGSSFALIAVGYGFGMFSAVYYAIAYSNYSDHEIFIQGLENQAFGALCVAAAGAWAASAFRRSARATAGTGLRDRERRLFRATCALAVGFLIISLGEALIAAGATQIGYSRADEAASWIGFFAELATVAALVVAAIGLRRAARG